MKVAATFERITSVAIIAVLIATVLIMGCDEGINMAGDIISEPAEVGPNEAGDTSPRPTVSDQAPDPAVVMGGVKDPNPEPPVTADPGSVAGGQNEASVPETPVTEPKTQEPVVTPEPSRPARPTPTGLSEERAREKAYGLIINDLYPVWERGKYTAETWDPYAAKIKDLFGLERSEAVTTLISIESIHLQEHPEDEEWSLAGKSNRLQLFAEYICLTYQYPESTHEEILALFEEVVQNGGTVLHWFEVELVFGILDPRYIQAKDIALTVFDRWAELLNDRRTGKVTNDQYDKALDRMYARETGLAYFDATFLRSLEDTYAGVYPEMDDFVSRESTVADIIPLIWEFMYVALQNPDSDRRQILWDFEAYIRENPVYAIGPEGYPVHAIELTVKRRYQWQDATFLN